LLGVPPSGLVGTNDLFQDGCPCGEMSAWVFNRADRFIPRLRVPDGNVALFLHVHFGRVLAARWIGLLVSEAQPHTPQFSVQLTIDCSDVPLVSSVSPHC